MKSLLLLPALFCVVQATLAWRFVSKVEELPVEETNRLEIVRPKVRLCGGDSEESSDCVLCTVCHPHEYELIGCSGQMDSVCASCSTGWMKSTPRTVDFFRKCKKHPSLPYLFSDVSYVYPLKLDAESSSMFADQEKRLHEAENENSDTDGDLLSEEEDYEDEDEEDEERLEENPREATGVDPVEVDERDEDSDEVASSGPEIISSEEVRFAYEFHHNMERLLAEKFEELERMDEEENEDDESFEEENSEEEEVEDVKTIGGFRPLLPMKTEKDVNPPEEERADPFDGKKEDKKEEEKEKEEEDSGELEYRVYPLHKVNIWKIIGPEKMKIDDKDISVEVQRAISDRKDEWRMTKGLIRMSGSQKIVRIPNEEELDEQYEPTKQQMFGGYRPLPTRYRTDITPMKPFDFFVWTLWFFLFALTFVVGFKICMIKLRRRQMILPEMDDVSRQLINEAHARIHAKHFQNSHPKPEFV